MQWTSKSSPRPKHFHLQTFKIKTILITFVDKQGVIHKEFVPEGQTVNSAFYVEVIGRLLKRISLGEAIILSRGQLVLVA
jgi:hypothetical protein